MVSFGAAGGAAALTDFAIAGGTAREGPLAYYVAHDDDLGQIVDAIVGGLRCVYGLDIALEDEPGLEVTLDGTTVVPPDSVNGWTYDAAAKSLSFHGTACAALHDRGTRVEFTLGC